MRRIALIALALAGCGDYFYPENVALAEKLCADRGGYELVEVDHIRVDNFKVVAHCRDKVVLTAKGQK